MEMIIDFVILPASFLWEELGKKYSLFKEKKITSWVYSDTFN